MEKIYLINYDFKENGRGIDTFSYRLYNELRKQNLDIEKIEIDNFYKHTLKYVKPIFINKSIRRKLIYTLNRKIIKNKNIHTLDPSGLPIEYLRLPKRKIVTVHDFYAFNEKQMQDRIKRFKGLLHWLAYRSILSERNAYTHLKDYDFVFAGSQEVLQRLVSDFGVDKERIEVSNYIMPDKFKPLNVEKDKNKVIIGYINNFNENKTEKLKLFIEVFKKIDDKSLEFHIYGKGFPFTDLIKDDDRIKYLGFLPEEKIVETYNFFDVYLSTSTVEGFGIPIMQAKACKVPVICYDGEIPSITRRNTLVWNDENLEEIIKNRYWEKIDVEKAYLDAEGCRADKVAPKIIEVYKRVFE